mmetsp:Transcript_25528/g.82499  ORF Transcript_25528/g.82499 Transcript_25528/m.82499 type:complete len:147 (+) Transcript_25528:62-502(+)
MRTIMTAVLLASAQAWTPASKVSGSGLSMSRKRCTALQGMKDLGSEGDFDKAVKDAGDSLMVVDFATTWCGPCKVMEPKMNAMSEEYTDAIFYKVIGDSSAEASSLMKREGVRAVPSFHFWKNGEKVDVVNGANIEAVTSNVQKYL